MGSDAYVDRIDRFLGSQGLPYRYERRRKHRSVVVTHEGRELRFAFPSTPSDTTRGPLNFISQLRRELGLRRNSP